MQELPCKWKQNGSLIVVDLEWIVKTFDLSRLVSLFSSLHQAQVTCASLGNAALIDGNHSWFIRICEDAARYCNSVGFSRSARKAFGLKIHFESQVYMLTHQAVQAEFRGLEEDIVLDITEHKFVLIDKLLNEYVEKDDFFGAETLEVFSNAKYDIMAAGNCLAVGLDTAAVFHLMRVAEHGLRSIARKVGVKLTDRGKPQPIEFATWDKVITAINNKIAAARSSPHGPIKNRRLQFYSDAAENCTYIRDLWRNEVSHTRKQYNGPEAKGVLNRVRDFMRLLAERKP